MQHLLTRYGAKEVRQWMFCVWDQPDTPDTPEDPGQKPDDPNQDQPELEKVGKARLVWIDAAANFGDYANSKENIAVK